MADIYPDNPLLTRLSHSRLRVRHLHMVIELVRHGSVHQAATALRLTQPAVTKALKELESLLGVPLFRREPRGLRPTPYCTPIERFARDVILGLEDLTGSIMALLRGEEGRAAIGAIEGSALGNVLDVIRQVRSEHPNIRFEISQGCTDDLLRKLDARLLDFALTARSRLLDEAGFTFKAVGRDSLVIAVRSQHPLIERQLVTRHDLGQWPWILPFYPDPLRESIELAFTNDGDPPPSDILESDSAATAIALVTGSDAIGVFTQAFVEPVCQAGMLTLLDTTLRLPQIPFGLVTHPRRRLKESAARVYAAIESRFAHMHPSREHERTKDALAQPGSALPISSLLTADS